MERHTAKVRAFPPRAAAGPAGPVADAVDEALSEEARFLHWFGQETIAFNRGYLQITGNVIAALWLSWVLERMPQEVRAGRASLMNDLYRFAMTGADCEEATGITRAQQAGCRRHLVELGLLQVVASRGRAVTYVVHLDRLRDVMTEQAQPLLAAMRQSRQSPAAQPVAMRGR